MSQSWFRIILLGSFALPLATCNQAVPPTLPNEILPQPVATLPNVDTQTEPAIVSPFQESEKDDTQMTQPTPPSGLESLTEKAKEDLAQRLGISVDSITVVAVIGQEFSSDAFYCHSTKERIAKEEAPQVITGQSILLSSSERRYEYHVSGQMVVFCQSLP